MRVIILPFLLFLTVNAAAVDVVVPFTLHRQHNVPIVEVKVNGRIARFILDTGSADTLIAHDLTNVSAPGPSEFRSDRNGLEVHGKWWQVDLEVGSRRWARRMVGIIDLTRVREFYGKDIAGILGQDVLREFESVRINYRRMTLTFDSP